MKQNEPPAVCLPKKQRTWIRGFSLVIRLGPAFALLLGCLLLWNCGQKRTIADKVRQSPFLGLDGQQSQVLSFDFQQIHKLSFFRRAKDAILKGGHRRQRWETFVSALGLDPFSSIDRIAVGLHAPLDLDDPLANAVIICAGQFENPLEIIDGFRKFSTQDSSLLAPTLFNPPEFKITTHEGVAVYSLSSPTYRDPQRIIEFHFAFPDGLMIYSRSANLLTASLDVIAGRTENLLSHEGWDARIGAARKQALFWGTGVFPRSLNSYLADRVQSEPEWQGLNGLMSAQDFRLSLATGSEYLLTIDLECDSFLSAETMTTDLKSARRIVPRMLVSLLGAGNPSIEIWKGNIFDPVTIIPTGSAVTVRLRMRRNDVERFVRQVISHPAAPAPVKIPPPFDSDEPIGRPGAR